MTPDDPVRTAAADIVATLRLGDGADAAEAAAIGRRFVHEHRDDLPEDMVQDAQLLVSEIVGNAVRYGRSDVTLKVRREPPGIGVAVVDDGEPIPEPATAAPDPTATSGRGLLIVDAIATAWGITPNRPPPGKCVWFELEAAD